MPDTSKVVVNGGTTVAWLRPAADKAEIDGDKEGGPATRRRDASQTAPATSVGNDVTMAASSPSLPRHAGPTPVMPR